MLQFRVAEGCRPTGRLLEQLVGRTVRNGVVCWGAGYNGELPALNKNCNRHNKLQQLEVLAEHGLRTVPFYRRLPEAIEAYPLLGRNFAHHGGLDIVLLLEPEQARLYRSDFYTKYIQRETEYRVWVYRRQHLGTYEKVLAHPEQARRRQRVGANWGNGFRFQLVQEGRIPRDAVDMASRAVEHLGLDFGAVDILRGRDGHFYILEVNTAPGVEGENRQVIQSLANKIRNWDRLNCVRRKGDK